VVVVVVVVIVVVVVVAVVAVATYEARTLLYNGVSVSNSCIGHRHSYDTCRICIREVSNLKSICWIFDNSSTVLTQF